MQVQRQMSVCALQGNRQVQEERWQGSSKRSLFYIFYSRCMPHESYSGSNDNSTTITTTNSDLYILKVFYVLGAMPDFLLVLLDFNSQLHEKDKSDFHVIDEAQRDKDNLPKVA